MKKQSTLFVFKFRGKREKDKADSDSTVPAKSTDKADSGASIVGLRPPPPPVVPTFFLLFSFTFLFEDFYGRAENRLLVLVI